MKVDIFSENQCTSMATGVECIPLNPEKAELVVIRKSMLKTLILNLDKVEFNYMRNQLTYDLNRCSNESELIYG